MKTKRNQDKLAVFVGDDFPEFGTDLVTALTGLDVNDFSQVDLRRFRPSLRRSILF